jgi:hypothetical protein
MTTITIDPRFCGPPESGNGGYVCGLLAQHVDGDAEVTLRLPPPLATPLAVERVDGGGVVLLDAQGATVAEAVPATIDIDVPAAVPVPDAARAAAGSIFLRDRSTHPFPTCFVCGPDRAVGDGLRLFAWCVEGRDVVAAAWEPHPSLPRDANDDALVAPEIVWSALDCPSCFSMYLDPPLEPPYVLGRLAARVVQPVRVGDAYAVMGWRNAVEGRKLLAGSAVHDASGALVAYARATWVKLKSPAA